MKFVLLSDIFLSENVLKIEFNVIIRLYVDIICIQIESKDVSMRNIANLKEIVLILKKERKKVVKTKTNSKNGKRYSVISI